MGNKPRVAICDLVTSFGGVQRVMLNILPELCRDYEIHVIDPYSNSVYGKALDELGVRRRVGDVAFEKPYIGGMRGNARGLRIVLALPKILKIRSMLARALLDIRPECIYLNQIPVLSLLGTIGRLRRIPVIYHAHGLSTPLLRGNRSAAHINRRVSKVIAVSRSTAEMLVEYGIKEESIVLCHNSVPVEKIEKESRLPPTSPLPEKHTNQTVFLLPASMQRSKGQHFAVEAARRLTSEGVDVAVWLAGGVPDGGDPSYVDELSEMTKRAGLCNRVNFLGWRKDIYAIMQAADVVMLCSETESFGMVLAEAMVLKKPCIGARTGGIPEVLSNGETGLLFEPGSVDSLISAMQTMALKRELRESYGRAAAERVKTCFNVRVQAQKISGIIGDLVKSGMEGPN